MFTEREMASHDENRYKYGRGATSDSVIRVLQGTEITHLEVQCSLNLHRMAMIQRHIKKAVRQVYAMKLGRTN